MRIHGFVCVAVSVYFFNCTYAEMPATESSDSTPVTDQATAQPLQEPDMPMLSDTVRSGLEQSASAPIIAIYRSSIKVINDIPPLIDGILETRRTLFDEYFNLDALLVDFFQSSDLATSIIQESLKPIQGLQTSQHEKVASARVRLQEVKADQVAVKKNRLKSILKEVDDDIVKSRKCELDAHKEGREILQQTSELVARKSAEDIKKQKEMLLKIVQDVDEKAKEFTTIAHEIKTITQKFHESLHQLQEEWNKLQAEFDKLSQPQQVSKEQKPQTTPQQQVPAVKEQQKDTFMGHVAERMKSLVVGAGDVMVDTYHWVREKVGITSQPTK